MSSTVQEPTSVESLYRHDRVHVPLPHPSAVTDADIARCHRDGFLAIENVFTPSEVQSIQDALTDLIAGRIAAFTNIELEGVPAGQTVPPQDREPYVRKLMDFSAADPRLAAMRDHPVLLALVQRIVGEKVTMIQDMALLKPPHIGREKPWHQDNAYFLYEPLDKVLGTWTALDTATVENGCMHVIPGSHRQGPQAHIHLRDCQLRDASIAVDQQVAIPLSPGGVLLFYGLLQHGTPPNRSPQRRRAVQLHYAAATCRQMTPQSHADLFHEGDTYAGCVGSAAKLKP